jgi:type IV secretion system protein VirB8
MLFRKKTQTSEVVANAAYKGNPLPAMDGLTFETEIARRSFVSERVAWTVAGVAVLLTVLSATAVVLMVPLKQTVPYYIYVDRQTGATQAVVVNDSQTITSNEAVARYWVSRYVMARERYVYRLQQEDYDLVMVTSAEGVGREYSKQYEGPNSKIETLHESVEDRIKILSVQLAAGTTGRATVRYQKVTWQAGLTEPARVETFSSDIAFGWVPVTGWSTRDLLANPMGFAVTAYRTNPELVQK